MKEETAVMWLQKLLENQPYLYKRDFEKALQMEREQIEQAYKQGCWDEIDERMESCVEESCKRYYTETYKGGEQ